VGYWDGLGQTERRSQKYCPVASGNLALPGCLVQSYAVTVQEFYQKDRYKP